jgi:hypothetical protein
MAEVTTIQIRGEDRTAAAFRSANKGLDRLERNLQAASAKTASLTSNLGKMGGVMAGLVGFGALGSFTSELLKTGDRLQKVSLQLGLTVDELEILQFAASQSGVETTALDTSLQKLTVNIGKAAEGTKAQKDAFEALGISVADADGNLSGTSETFVQVAEAISGIEDPAKKAQIATDLFGRAGVELLPLLNSGAAGISQFAQTIRDAGGIIGQDGADEISKFNDGIDLLSRSLRGKVAPVLVAVLPALTALAENLDEVAKFAAVVGAGFIAAKIPAAFLAITAAVKGLTIAMAANPLGLIATGLAAIAVYKGDDIMKAFGFAEEAPKELEKTNTKLEETAKQLNELDKVEQKRVETSEEFAKTTKKEVVPQLKNLDRALRASSIEFKNIRGPEGLGGLTRAFIEFFGNIQTVALNTLTDIERLVEGTFSLVKQDFREFFQALDNIVIFEGQEVRDAFRDMIQDLADQVKTQDIGATELFRVVQETIDAVDIFSVSGHVDRSASSILNITGTKTVNARDIFRVSGTVNIDLSSIERNTTNSVKQSMARVADAVNFYGVRSNRVSIGYAGSQRASLYENEPFNRGQVRVSYESSTPRDPGAFYDYKTLSASFPVMTGPGVTAISGIYGGGRSSGRSPAASQVDESMSSGAPVVNVFLDLEGEVKLPLHEYIVSTQNRAERSGNQELAGILGGDGSYA